MRTLNLAFSNCAFILLFLCSCTKPLKIGSFVFGESLDHNELRTSSGMESFLESSFPPMKYREIPKGAMENGMKEGTWTEWYPSVPRQRLAEGSYHKELKEGEWKYWYLRAPSHQEFEDITFRNGKRVPRPVHWFAAQGHFKKGKLDGKWTTWDRFGCLKNTFELKDGIELKNIAASQKSTMASEEQALKLLQTAGRDQACRRFTFQANIKPGGLRSSTLVGCKCCNSIGEGLVLSIGQETVSKLELNGNILQCSYQDCSPKKCALDPGLYQVSGYFRPSDSGTFYLDDVKAISINPSLLENPIGK